MRHFWVRGGTLTLAPMLSNPASTSHPVTDKNVERHRALALIPGVLPLWLTSIHQLMVILRPVIEMRPKGQTFFFFPGAFLNLTCLNRSFLVDVLTDFKEIIFTLAAKI